ncbi:C6 transcription factor [Penicillium nucicola]|uniref:C6 transcription factor n=1 Tax=Penicillium nucicola TaxID=1850975 RepID=UPI002544E5D0|nr:C6 transcription factor [Penicillium nucicola]KAJ5751433.1 C6 transcription factor [Penicillium nucicola]
MAPNSSMRYASMAVENTCKKSLFQKGKTSYTRIVEVVISLRDSFFRYAEILEQDQALLVKGMRELYGLSVRGESWPGELLNNTDKEQKTQESPTEQEPTNTQSPNECFWKSTADDSNDCNAAPGTADITCGDYSVFPYLTATPDHPSLFNNYPGSHTSFHTTSPTSTSSQEVVDSATFAEGSALCTNNDPMVYGHDNDTFYQYDSGTNLFPHDEWTAEPTFGLDEDTPTIPRFGEVSSTSEAKQVYIHAYFFYYHKINPFIHEETFKLHLSTQCLPETEEKSWYVLQNSVLAMGAWCVYDGCSNTDILYYERAKRLFLDISSLGSDNIMVVQALLLLSDYAQKRGKIETAYHYLEQTVRVALSIGLHKEKDDELSVIETVSIDQEIRRRLWWSIYNHDSYIAMRNGRQRFLRHYSETDVKLPLNVDNQILPPDARFLVSETDWPTLYSGLIAHARFNLLANSVYERIASQPALSAMETLNLQTEIDDHYANIPLYLKRDDTVFQPEWLLQARSRLLWGYKYLQALICRPFLVKMAGHKEQNEIPQPESESRLLAACRARCILNSTEIIESMNDYTSTNTVSRLDAWNMVYLLFQASITPITLIRTKPQSADALFWWQDLEKAQRVLSTISKIDKAMGTDSLEAIKANYLVATLEQLRTSLDTYSAADANGCHFLITVSCHTGPTNYQKLHVAQMDNHMGYNYSGSWDTIAGHDANIYASRADSFSIPLNRVATNKIVMRMSLYGRSFMNTAGPGTSFNGVSSALDEAHGQRETKAENTFWEIMGMQGLVRELGGSYNTRPDEKVDKADYLDGVQMFIHPGNLMSIFRTTYVNLDRIIIGFGLDQVFNINS